MEYWFFHPTAVSIVFQSCTSRGGLDLLTSVIHARTCNAVGTRCLTYKLNII